jgi:ABC-2 type transport system permease protein
MRELMIIVEREFRERVQTRSFVIGTLVFPIFMVAIFFLPALVGGGGARQVDVAVVDRAPAGVGDAFEQALLASATLGQAAGPAPEGAEPTAPTPEGSDAAAPGLEASEPAATEEAAPEEAAVAVPGDVGRTYTVERLPGDSPLDALNRRVLAGELDGYIVLPADLLEGGSVVYRAKNIANQYVLRDLRLAGTAAVQARRLGAAGLDAAVVQRLLDPVTLTSARITASGEEGGDAQGTFLVAYMLAFLAYMVIAMYGHAVMRSVIQEKVTRISEILVSTVKAMHLMAGKIAGVSAAALLQVAIWGAMVTLAVTQSHVLQERFGVSASLLDAFRLEPGIGIVLVLFFVLGFLLFASLFAALGAAMSTEQEAQPFQMVLMLPLFVPLIFLGPITSDPDGGLAVFLGLFPLTAPVAMPMRLAAAPPDPAMIAASLGLLVLATVAMAWLAGKIYRVGILATGKRPTMSELVRWIRAA